MKFKKLTAVLLSAVTLAAAPSFPTFHSADSDITITAEAANTLIAQISSNLIKYALYKDSSGSRYAVVTGSDSNVQNVTINANITYDGETYPITKIEANAFDSRSKLNEVDLSKAYRLTSIESNAFKNSTVKTVRIGSTRLTIKTNAFYNTRSLNTVTVTADTDTVRVAKHAFYESSIQNFYCYCYGVIISSDAFEKSSLKNVLFTSHVQTITLADCAFSGLTNLYSVEFSNQSVNLSMGVSVFAGATKLYTVRLPESLSSIPQNTFYKCSNLTIFSIPSGVKKICNWAFKESGLRNTVIIGPNVTSIENEAFREMPNVTAFYVNPSNNYFMSDSGALYSKGRNRLYAYPAKKTDPSFIVPSKYISEGAIYNNIYLKSLSIANLETSNSEAVCIKGLENLEEIKIPQTDYVGKTVDKIITKYYSLFNGTQVYKINGIPIVSTSTNTEPSLNNQSKFTAYIYEHFHEFGTDKLSFVQYYINKLTEYVISTTTDSSMTDMQKAVRLHNWVLNRVVYDPDEAKYWDAVNKGKTADESLYDERNHVESSIFLHYDTKKDKNGKDKTAYYSVCQGIANGYLFLLKKAGINDCYYVHGKNHGWTMLKINGKYYHVDISADNDLADHSNSARNFDYFMLSDNDYMAKKGVQTPYWSYLADAPADNAVYSMHDLGRPAAGQPTNEANLKTAIKRLQTIINGMSTPSEYEFISFDLDFNNILDARDLSLLKQYYNNRSTYNTQYGSVANWIFSRLS